MNQPAAIAPRPVPVGAAPDALPDLDCYTDLDTMARVFQTRLPGFAEGQLRLEGLQVDSVRRSTSRRREPVPLSLRYRLEVSELSQSRRGAQSLFGQVWRSRDEGQAQAARSAGPLAQPAFGAPRVFLPEWHLLLWAMPNDPGLPQMPRLLDPTHVRRRLACVGLAGAADAVTVELLRHVPHSRATLRYRVQPAHGGAPTVVYAKTFADDRAAAVDARFGHFWRLAQADAQAPLVAQPLGHDAACRCVWQAEAQGQPLSAALGLTVGTEACVKSADTVNAFDAAEWLARAARALAHVHRAPLALAAGARAHDQAYWLGELDRRTRKLCRVDADWGVAAADITRILARRVPAALAAPVHLIHGDCHVDQLWTQRERIVMFDLDECVPGDPMEDLAACAVKLEQAGVAAPAVRAWIDAYAAFAPSAFDPSRLAWHRAAQSLLQVTRAFVYQRPGWREALPQRLAVAHALARALDRGEAL